MFCLKKMRIIYIIQIIANSLIFLKAVFRLFQQALIKIYGSKSLVFIDESGFEEFEGSVYAWAKRGKKVYGERTGKRGKRENLVAARRKGKKDLIAPMIFMGSLNAEGFEGWLSLYLLPDLTSPSIL